MIRSIVAAALAAVTLHTGALRAQESVNTGLMLGLHAVPMGIDGVGEEQFSETGMGLGATLGWGFNDRIAVYATTDFGYVDYDPDNPAAVGEDYEAMTVDLGARVNLGNEFMRMRPFINAALSVLMTTEDDPDLGEAVTAGGGLTVGGGFQYFVHYQWSVLAAVQATMGAFTETDAEDANLVFSQGVPYSHYRVQLGAMWHP